MNIATISVRYVNDSQDFTECVSLVTLFILKKTVVSSSCSSVAQQPNSGLRSLTVEVPDRAQLDTHTSTRNLALF